MRFAYAGTAPFAELVLEGLAAAGRRPAVLVTNPDRPRGRHGTPQPPRIKLLAGELGIPVLQPERLSDPGSVELLLATGPDVLVDCAYGQIVAQHVLDAVETIVVHPSLVPRWRGAAPVERALMAGETELGVCTLRMTAGVDEGPVGDERPVHVPRDADAGRAYELLAPAAVEGIIATLDGIAAGTVTWRPQEGEATYAAKIGPDDKEIDWSRRAAEIADQVRALSPHIGAVTELAGRRTRIWRASAGRWPHAGGRTGPPRHRRRGGLAGRARAAAGGTHAHGGGGIPARRRPRSAGAVTAAASGAADATGVSPARAAAFAALRRLRLSGSRLDDSAAALPELSSLGSADRGLANELVNGTVKRRGSIDAVLDSYTKAPLKSAHPDVRDALRLAAFQLLFLDRVPVYAVVDDAVTLATRTSRRAGGFVNAVLRRVAADGRARLSELGEGDSFRHWSAALSYPPWLVKLLREELGDAPARRLLEAANAAPERCLRANRLRGGLPAAAEALAAEGFVTRGVGGLPDGLVYEGPPLERSGAFRRGLVTAQSRGSQIAGIVAAGGVSGPGAAVLDLCAAPGAKTSQLAALLPGAAITAVEVDEDRAEDLRRNLARLGADEVGVVRADALQAHADWEGGFDAVLLDPPCSGLGTLASRADVRWRRHPSDVPRLAQLQARLLARAAAAVKPGGALTYAVCTLTRAETLGVVEPLLGAGGWTADDLGAVWPGLAHPSAGGFLLVLPPDAGSSGFFIARLRRAGQAGDQRPASAAAG